MPRTYLCKEYPVNCHRARCADCGSCLLEPCHGNPACYVCGDPWRGGGGFHRFDQAVGAKDLTENRSLGKIVNKCN